MQLIPFFGPKRNGKASPETPVTPPTPPREALISNRQEAAAIIAKINELDAAAPKVEAAKERLDAAKAVVAAIEEAEAVALRAWAEAPVGAMPPPRTEERAEAPLNSPPPGGISTRSAASTTPSP